jgi:DNA-binding NarL/FixJ family response regulator
MRKHDVLIPNRSATVAENDRLLATLVADGASNRELATVLLTSEKSIEGMLARLFARTGYRSRVDLAAAVLTGGYPG